LRLISAILISISLALLQPLSAQVSYFGALKTGGFSGRFNIGAGMELSKIPLEVSAWLGYTNHRDWNEEVSCQQISLLTHPVLWSAAENRQFCLSTGLSGILYQSTNIFWKLPPQFPDGYYKPTNFHGLAHLGLSYKGIAPINERNVSYRIGLEWVSDFNSAWLAISNNYPSLPGAGTLGFNLRVYATSKKQD
jgi:hypothetical protein